MKKILYAQSYIKYKLRVCRNSDNRYFIFPRAIKPKNSVCGGSVVLSVGLKNFLSIWTTKRRIFMSI